MSQLIRFGDSEITSTGAFLVGELEKLDRREYAPIADFTWGRDIDLRTDVTVADEATSFILTNYAGGFGGTGVGSKSWITGRDSTPAQVAVSATKVLTPVTPWGMEVSYSVIELQKAMQVGRPIDVQKYNAMKFKFELDTDAQVYIGDAEVGTKGLLNNDAVVAPVNVGAINYETAQPSEILALFNEVLNEAWKQMNYVRIPNRVLVPPKFFAFLSGTQLPNTGKSLLQFVLENNLSRDNGVMLEIHPVKWLADESVFATPRMVAYVKDESYVRFPRVELQALPVQYRDFMQAVPYLGALGGVEFVRPESVFYGVLA